MSLINQRHDATTDSYDISVCNTTEENSLDDEQISCASNFNVILHPQLNLHSLLFLRAVEAEIALSTLHISTLPLTFSRQEKCYVKMRIDESAADCNRTVNRYFLKRSNEDSLVIDSEDQNCAKASDAVEYVNELLQYNINYFIIARLLHAFCDTDVIKILHPGPLNHQDIRLLLRFIDITFFTRLCIHNHLCALAQIENDDISDRFSYWSTPANKITRAKETKSYDESEVLNRPGERVASDGDKLVKFDELLQVELSRQSEERDAVENMIKTETLYWLQQLGFVLENGLIAEADKTEFNAFIVSNKKLVDIGNMAKSILLMEKERIDQRKQTNDLFHRDFVLLALDRNKEKCKFHLFPKQFLPPDCDVTIFFPKLMSYSLGAELDQHVIIGPIAKDMKFEVPSRLTNIIASPHQRLYCNIRTMPRIIHITTNIVATKGRNTWPRSAKFEDYEVIYSLMVDELCLNSRSISATNCIETFHKLRHTHLLLETMSFSIMNENMRLCNFAQKTYTKLGFKIKPVSLS